MSSNPVAPEHARACRVAARIQRHLCQGTLRDQWTEVAGALAAALLDTPLAQLIDAERVGRALDAALSETQIAQTTQPLLRQIMVLVMTRLRQRPEPAGELVPDRARELLDELVAHPDIVPASVVREIMHDPAVDAVLRDVLFEALRQFSENVSPFTAEWGLPALLKRLPPFGSKPIRTAIETMGADFDKRLEPEIRKFLDRFSKRAAKRLTELSLRKQQEPEFVALRQRIVAALLKRELGELCWPPDDRRGELLIEVAVEITGHVAQHEALRAELDELLERALAAHGERPLGEILAALGITLPDVTAMADAYWPALERALGSAPVLEHLEVAVARALAEETAD